MLLTVLSFVVIGLSFIWTQKLPVKGDALVVLGSGGHTGEMLAILSRLDFGSRVLRFVYGEGDSLSIERARSSGYQRCEFSGLRRARKVGQSYITSLFTSFLSFIMALRLVWQVRPGLLLCNGPGTCVVVVLAVRVLALRTKVVYIESLARVNTLSLSGKVIYHLQLADKFVVQWPELYTHFPGTELAGILV